MHKVKVIVAKIIWKICGISNNTGNMIMDIIGYENYMKVIDLKNEKVF